VEAAVDGCHPPVGQQCVHPVPPLQKRTDMAGVRACHSRQSYGLRGRVDTGPEPGRYGMLENVSPIPVADDVLDPDVATLSLDDGAACPELVKRTGRQV